MFCATSCSNFLFKPLQVFLNLFENELTRTNLEIARQRDPWELISEPTLAKGQDSSTVISLLVFFTEFPVF